MTEDEYLTQRMRDKRPFEDGLGMRGHQPVSPLTREFLGQVGGNGSYQVKREAVAPDPFVNNVPAGQGAPPAGTKQLIVNDNGTLNYYNFDASFVGPV